MTCPAASSNERILLGIRISSPAINGEAFKKLPSDSSLVEIRGGLNKELLNNGYLRNEKERFRSVINKYINSFIYEFAIELLHELVFNKDILPYIQSFMR
jgi:hypothetical protein